MSWDEIKKGVNSDLNVPLNHLIWLNDYKAYGKKSYVFRDKRILKELYASPITANDAQIFDEALAYNRANMSKDNVIKWYKLKYDNDKNDEELKLFFSDFSSLSFEEFAGAIEKHYNNEIDLSKCFSAGDKISVNLSAMEASGVGESHVAQTVEFAIADFDHDDLVTPINGHTKAAITFTQIGVLKNRSSVEGGYMNSSNTNVGGWKSCARRTWCNNVYYNALPDEIKRLVKEVKKLTSAGNRSSTIDTTNDKVFLLSEVEIFGSVYRSVPGEGAIYPYYDSDTNKNKTHTYWERSPYNGSDSHFCCVYGGGSSNCEGSTSAYSFACNFCV